MAKVTGPLMSIDASGAFADTMVYAKWKGIKYSRQYAIPSGPAPKTTEILSLGADGKTWGLLLVEGA